MVESLNSPRCGLLGMEELSRAKCVAFLGGSARAKFVTCFCKLLSCVDQKKSQEQWEGAKDENIPSSSIVNGCLAQFPQEKHGKTQPVVPQ